MPSRRVVVGFSGGITSAWCAGWALRTFPRDYAMPALDAEENISENLTKTILG